MRHAHQAVLPDPLVVVVGFGAGAGLDAADLPPFQVFADFFGFIGILRELQRLSAVMQI